AQVKEVVRSVLGGADVLVDKDGDIPIRSEASVTYVRVFKDVPVVRVFSPVLWDLGNPSDIAAAVNDINRTTNWVKAIWENGTVVLFSDVVGEPLAESQLAAAINSVVHRADEMGPVLQRKYGGRTAFGAPLPPRHLPIGGYL
ncbi:MAG TPA: YbjN domain-containing protein, partial [Acidimicrobiales bacterium]|nr:YbjN domain-containing protein [Acidimicrobiales bacterium]